MVPSERETILIVDDDAEITDGLAAALESETRRIITCNDVESAQLVLERMAVHMLVSDVRFSGPFAFEGLDIIGFAREKAPEVRIVLMSGTGNREIETEAFRRGATAFLHKPFDVGSLEALLTGEIQ
ncbi:MAG TPA: response regulator [Thermoanaerobaculia bacterium]|nr:response regulator [Thermoanaerobaculia bacterium]